MRDAQIARQKESDDRSSLFPRASIFRATSRDNRARASSSRSSFFFLLGAGGTGFFRGFNQNGALMASDLCAGADDVVEGVA